MKEEYKPYFEPESETASEDKLRELQFNKLKNVLNIVSKSNPFYRRKFQKHGVSVQEIKSLDDLRKIPFSYKEEFQKDQRGNPPFGTNLSEPLESYTRYHQTSGTTGLPLKWLDTEKSWRWRGKCAAMALWGAGLRPSDIVFFPFAFGPHVAFWGLFEGAQLAGALVIAGGGWNTLQRVKSIIENRVSIICCTPTYALRMAEVAERERIDIKKSSVRVIVTAGEPGALVPAIRDKIKQAWGAVPFDYPGLTEVGAYAIHCQNQERSIHVNESEFIIEVIDPDSGNPVPEGEIGEMVLTNLGRSCSPGIRFRTGDLVKLGKSNCPCGRTFRLLIGGVLGRRDDMIIIRGMNIFPSKIGEAVEKFLALGEEYRVVAYTKNGMGELKVQIEFAPGRDEKEISNMITKELRDQFELRIDVEGVSAGTLPRSDYKSRRFLDERT